MINIFRSKPRAKGENDVSLMKNNCKYAIKVNIQGRCK